MLEVLSMTVLFNTFCTDTLTRVNPLCPSHHHLQRFRMTKMAFFVLPFFFPARDGPSDELSWATACD